MTLLSVVQQHCRVHALAIPSVVVSATDAGTQQLLGIMNELVDTIGDESKWQAYVKVGSWTTLAAQDQGLITTIAPNGWLSFSNSTFYNQTLNLPIFGPLSDVEWEALQAGAPAMPFYNYRVFAGHFWLNPAPAAGQTMIFEYSSKYGVQSAALAYKQYFTADDDTFVLSEAIIQAGLAFRWKQIKGLPYQADEARYYKLLNNAIARDGSKRAYDLAEVRYPQYPAWPQTWIRPVTTP